MANNNLCFTLAFNLVSETNSAVERLYAQNDRKDFFHTIFDCSFPLIEGDKIPDDISEAKELNSISLKSLAEKHGSDYQKIHNIGVSQNWQQVYQYYSPDDSDILVTCEPDEIQHEDGWINAIANVIRSNGNMGYVAPMLIDHKENLKKNRYAHLESINGYSVYVVSGNLNYGQIGISAAMLNKMGGMGVPKKMPVYGGIESVLLDAAAKQGVRWGILKDYTQTHTNVPILLRQWKNEIIFNINERGQYSFEKWLSMKKSGEI